MSKNKNKIKTQKLNYIEPENVCLDIKLENAINFQEKEIHEIRKLCSHKYKTIRRQKENISNESKLKFTRTNHRRLNPFELVFF